MKDEQGKFKYQSQKPDAFDLKFKLISLISSFKENVNLEYNKIKSTYTEKSKTQIQSKKNPIGERDDAGAGNNNQAMVGGQQIRVGHEKFDLILNILIGIKRSTSNLMEIPFMELSSKQFKMKNKISN